MVDAPYSYLCPALMFGSKSTSEQTYLHKCTLNATVQVKQLLSPIHSNLRLMGSLQVLESLGTSTARSTSSRLFSD
jgi:hypothetical protein